MLRAYDKATGREVGAVYLPAPQSGSPMTYGLRGRQYIVVAVSGGNSSGEYLAEMVRQSIHAQYGDETYSRGLSVYTTVLHSDQEVAYRALRKGIMDYERRQVYRAVVQFLRGIDRRTAGGLGAIVLRSRRLGQLARRRETAPPEQKTAGLNNGRRPIGFSLSSE